MARKRYAKNLPLTMRADDIMPWGKHEGESLRRIFNSDPDYIDYLVNRHEYKIPKRTIELLENHIEEIDKTPPTFSKGARGDKKELTANDIVLEKDGVALSLQGLFISNESYYRAIVNRHDRFVSQQTFEQLMKLKYGPDSVKHKTRQEINAQIDNVINGFSFTEDERYSDDDLTEYLGEMPETSLSKEISTLIKSQQDEDTFALQRDLREIYGENASFRPGQEEAVLAVLNGKKTLVVQHTGWGKSLVYFLSIKKLRELGRGVAIIISPLVALMHNQVEAAEKFGLTVRYISSDNKSDWSRIYADVQNNEIDGLLISPERLGNENFKNFLTSMIESISLFVVDEAHCISDWGHDFRPDFRRIVKLIRQLPQFTPILATTATANNRVVRDIKYQLGTDIEIMRGTMERTSLSIDVLNMTSDTMKKDWLVRNLHKIPGTGIVYCLTIPACEDVVKHLREHGINAMLYHGKLSVEDRSKREKIFQENRIKVLVATIAFGMGIDKPDISFVIHYHQPANTIAYYQQIGRAGRSIPNAYTILLAGDNDNEINQYFIKNAFPTENEMNEVVEYISEHPGERRYDIIAALGQTQTWFDKISKYLLVNGDIYQKYSRYYKSSKIWTCDMQRAKLVSWYRWQELRRFNQFVNTDQCYMSFIREDLDDTDITPCGRCSNCTGRHFWI